MSATTMVHIRVDKEIKAQAKEALAAMGLSMSDAIRVFLTRVVAEQQLPFTLQVPNKATREAMTEAEEIATAHKARFSGAEELFDSLEEDSGK